MNNDLSRFAVYEKNGELHMEDVSLAAIAAEYGTPCYVYSRAALANAYQRLDSALQAALPNKKYLICYAVKANSNLAVLSLFAKLGAGFDIVSAGELHRVLSAGGDAGKVVFSGVGKTQDEMRLALLANVKCFNVESESELERLNRVAGALGKIAPVSLRINPNVDPKTHPYISTGLAENKFGIAHERALDVYRLAASLPHLNVTGVDCHIGSQLLDYAPLVEGMQRMVELSDQLSAAGIAVRHICPGGGIGISYTDEQTINLDHYAAALATALGDRPFELLLEPGRALVGNAGVLLSRVEYLKHTQSKNFMVIDAAMNDLIRPALYEAHHEIVAVRTSTMPTKNYDVVGPICESGDFIGHHRALAVAEGDLVAILSAGAYAMTMASNYNTRPRAAEVMVDGNTTQLVRTRETFAHLLAGEYVGKSA